MAGQKEWTTNEVEEMISAWESCPCLWDVTSKEYKDKQKKKEALLEIATTFYTTVEEITKKMKSLRAQHNREKNKVMTSMRSGAGTDDIPKVTWVHYDQLHFLDEIAGKRTATRSNLTNHSQVEIEFVRDNEGFIEENNEDSDQLPEIQNSTKKPLQGKKMSKKRRIEENEHNFLDRAAMALERATMPDLLVEKPKTADDIFGQYVASELKAIDDERLKKFIKHKIQTVIYECTCNMPMTPQIAVSPQVACYNTELLSPPIRSVVNSTPMKCFETPVTRPQSRQEIFRTPSPYQGGPSSQSTSPSASLSSLDSQTLAHL